MIRYNVNVATILKTPTLLGAKLGMRAFELLESKFLEMGDDACLVIDMTYAIVLDYFFCSTAIGKLFTHLQVNPRKYIIIEIDDDQKLSLLEGILWSHSNVKNHISAEETFVNSGLFVKIHYPKRDELEFVGRKQVNEQAVLDIVNEAKRITAAEIANKMSAPVEHIIKSLTTLKDDNYFIYIEEEQTVVYYCSFYNIFKEN
jgi:hypothetical protein